MTQVWQASHRCGFSRSPSHFNSAFIITDGPRDTTILADAGTYTFAWTAPPVGRQSRAPRRDGRPLPGHTQQKIVPREDQTTIGLLRRPRLWLRQICLRSNGQKTTPSRQKQVCVQAPIAFCRCCVARFFLANLVEAPTSDRAVPAGNRVELQRAAKRCGGLIAPLEIAEPQEFRTANEPSHNWDSFEWRGATRARRRQGPGRARRARGPADVRAPPGSRPIPAL